MPRYDYPYDQVRYRRRSSPGRVLAGLALLLGVTLEGIAALLRSTGGDGSGLVVTGLILACVGLLGLRATRSASAVRVVVWSRRSRRNDGVASSWTLLTRASRWAMLRRAHIWRPSLAAVPWWRRWRIPASEYAVRVARVGALTVWSPVEDVTLRVGGPRTGKSGEMADHIADAPGAVIATSTRLDLLETVGPLRARTGPVWVFNPSGLADVASPRSCTTGNVGAAY